MRAATPFRQAARAVEALDRYTSPRSTTGGNFERPNLFQAVVDGATEGFYLMDLPGVFIQGGAGAAGSLARRYVADSPWVGALAGSAMGTAMAVATTCVTGAPVTPALMTCGALLGCYSGLRGDRNANIRDSGVNGLLISAPFISGPAKVVGGLGAIVGAHFENEKHRVLAAALSGTGFAVALSLAGVLPMDPLKAAFIGCVASTGGSVLGPRMNQFFRNLAEDVGEKGRSLTGLKQATDGEDSPSKKWARTLGVIPLSFGKEMIMAGLYGDGAWIKGLAGGVVDSVLQGNIMYHSKEEKDLPRS